jgi:hypothetical protein
MPDPYPEDVIAKDNGKVANENPSMPGKEEDDHRKNRQADQRAS